MTFHITVDTNNNSSTFTQRCDTIQEAVDAAKAFAVDWWRDAEYFVFCNETGQYQMGKAN